MISERTKNEGFIENLFELAADVVVVLVDQK